MSPHARLRLVKLLHTVVWAFFAICIFAIPVLAWQGMPGASLACAGIVFAEVAVLLLNGRRCPLTAIAARYTDDRRENFDIYLPRLLAKHNQTIFGSLYLAGTAYALLAWLRAST